jgi:SAM-dependent methyltransferase
MPFEPKNRRDIQQTASLFQQSRALLSAFELNLFTAIDERPSSAEEIAERADVSAAGAERLLNALVAMNYVRKENGKFSNAPAASEYLVEGKPNYLGGLIHTSHTWDNWSHLTEATRIGARPEAAKDQHNDEWTKPFIRAMHDRGVSRAREIADKLDLTGVTRILDVGGGSGCFATEFLRRTPGARAVVFDLPNVLPVTKEFVERDENRDRVELRAGDYRTADFGEGHDFVFLSAIVHINSYESNRDLLRRCAKATSSGGRVVVSDYVMNEPKTEPAVGALFSLNMLVATEEGDVFNFEEIREWMTDSGLEDVRLIEIDGVTALVEGRKP